MIGLGLTKLIPICAYITFVIVVILTLLYEGRFGLYLLVLLVPLQNLTYKLIQYPFGKDILDILLIVTFIRLVLLKKKRQTGSQEQIIKIYVTILILSTYTGLWVGSLKLGLPYPISFANTGVIEWKNYIMAPLLYFLTFNAIEDKKHAIFIVLIMTTTMFLMSGKYYESARWADHAHFTYDKRGMGSSFVTLGPNEIAAFFAQGCIFLLGIILYDDLWYRKLLFAAYLSSSFYCVLFLFSRGAYAAVFTGLIFYGLIKNRIILIMLFIFLLIWQLVLPGAVVERINMSKSSDGTVDRSISVRFELWKKAAVVIKSNPISGVGFGSTKHMGFKTGEDHYRKDVHNGYLEILMEQGIIGLFIVLSIFYMAISRSLRLIKITRDNFIKGISIGYIGMIITIITLNYFGDRWSYLPLSGNFWILFGIIAKLNEIESSEKVIADKSNTK